jgi:hypothetical protein
MLARHQEISLDPVGFVACSVSESSAMPAPPAFARKYECPEQPPLPDRCELQSASLIIGQFPDETRSVCLKVTDWLHRRAEFHCPPPCIDQNIVHVQVEYKITCLQCAGSCAVTEPSIASGSLNVELREIEESRNSSADPSENCKTPPGTAERGFECAYLRTQLSVFR